MQSLPIDALIPQILQRLCESPNLVVESPPGSGKTTRVPPALLNVAGGEVWVLEPRRLAARLAARRVASELGEKVGETVGYQVRFEEVSGPRTRLRFLTEGVLTRKLLSNRRLAGVSAVVLDEFHERHLEGDLALALLLRLQRTSRPDLRLVVMSATLDAAPIAAHLGGCDVLRSEGRPFEVEIAYSPVSPHPIEQQVETALRRWLQEGSAKLDGDVLVFLAGAAEIRRSLTACEPLARQANLVLAALHGDLSPEEQDNAIRPAARPKVIFSTNVAESSITIEGVRAVIDSGLARVAGHSAWSGLPTLAVSRISKASANQRAGRAGRTGPGKVIRLYSQEDFQRRPAQDTAEIAREELSQTYLAVKAMAAGGIAELPWLEAPPPQALRAAEDLLARLGALDAALELTSIGREMAGLPLHPRLGRLVVEARRRDVAEDGCAIAALLSAGERMPEGGGNLGPSDLLFLLDRPFSHRAQRTLQQIRRIAGSASKAAKKSGVEHDAALMIAILTAFPDRVARAIGGSSGSRDGQGVLSNPNAGRGLLLAAGGGATLARSSVVQRAALLVAVEAEDRRDQGPALIRLASAIEPEWLLDLYPERIEERNTLEWNRAAERVESASALLYDGLVIEESRGGSLDREAASKLLAEKALEAGLDRFVDREELDAWMARVQFASEHSAITALEEDDLRQALNELSAGLRSFSELQAAARGGGFLRLLAGRLAAESARLIDQLAPESIRLPSGRRTRVHYEPGKSPWIASRLQDFFGMKETPRVANGRVPVVAHLLAPNQRPVQMTSDLAGFWERLYPEIRRQLSRRYPKHRWPEKP